VFLANFDLFKNYCRLEAYPVGFEGLRVANNVAAMNEDHRWFHVDVLITYYLYKPEEGQQLTGISRLRDV
jgi:hypothetical protein